MARMGSNSGRRRGLGRGKVGGRQEEGEEFGEFGVICGGVGLGSDVADVPGRVRGIWSGFTKFGCKVRDPPAITNPVAVARQLLIQMGVAIHTTRLNDL